MQYTKMTGPVGAVLSLMLVGFAYFAGVCGAEALSIREIMGHAAQYKDRQVQVDGRVERWVDDGGVQKTRAYVLKDNFGDEMRVKMTDNMPAVGEKVSVKGLVTFESARNDYYLQSLNNASDVKPDVEGGKNASSRFLLTSKLTDPPLNLIALAVAAAIVFIFIAGVAVRVKRANLKVIDVPDFSFDETETIKIDVNGKIFGSKEDDESTVIMMPGHFKITGGPKGIEGQLYRLTSALTKVGREESAVNKTTGWITVSSSCTTVSRHQADLVYKGGVYYVENKSRSTQTLVNGVPLKGEELCPLSDNDVIAFGDIELTYIGPS